MGAETGKVRGHHVRRRGSGHSHATGNSRPLEPVEWTGSVYVFDQARSGTHGARCSRDGSRLGDVAGVRWRLRRHRHRARGRARARTTHRRPAPHRHRVADLLDAAPRRRSVARGTAPSAADPRPVAVRRLGCAVVSADRGHRLPRGAGPARTERRAPRLRVLSGVAVPHPDRQPGRPSAQPGRGRPRKRPVHRRAHPPVPAAAPAIRRGSRDERCPAPRVCPGGIRVLTRVFGAHVPPARNARVPPSRPGQDPGGDRRDACAGERSRHPRLEHRRRLAGTTRPDTLANPPRDGRRRRADVRGVVDVHLGAHRQSDRLARGNTARGRRSPASRRSPGHSPART